MATLENIELKPSFYDRKKKEVVLLDGKSINVPYIFFEDGKPWEAANVFAIDKSESCHGGHEKTVKSTMSHLKSYATWLEENKLDWRHFPKKKKDRVLFKYRGFLINQRDIRTLAPSTVTSRMAAVIRFYRWAQINEWIEKKSLWEDQIKTVGFFTTVGLQRTMAVTSSELAIPNRTRIGNRLEDGLLPITKENRGILLNYLEKNSKVELLLMSKVGFLTGSRSETIRSLRIPDLELAIVDSQNIAISYIQVGPPTRVLTKYSVSGQIPFPTILIKELLRYAYSTRRLVRQSKAEIDNRTLLFLTVQGNQYSETSFTKLISDLRKEMSRNDLNQFSKFIFHQTRATFGTELMRLALEKLPSPSDAIRYVRDAMLHKGEATTWKYVKFIEQEPIKERLSIEFYNLFSGSIDTADAEKLVNLATYTNE